MPDVKWYSASTASTGISVAAGSGTTNRLMKFDASDNAADSSWTDASNLLTSTTAIGLGLSTTTPNTYEGTAALTAAITASGTDAGVGAIGSNTANLLLDRTASSANQRIIGIDNTSVGFAIKRWADNFGSSVTYMSAVLSTDVVTLGSASVAGLTLTSGTGEITCTAGQSFNIGNAATAPASNYLVIGGVSGAGGTPTTTHITAGSGVAIYVQEAHDAQATKFVIAYNNYNGINYLVGTLDGTTATWTNSTTRP